MPFIANWPLPSKVRGNPLGFPWLNKLGGLQLDNERFALVEHTADGQHNALEVARGVASVSWDGSSYSIDAGSDTEVTGVNRIGAGVIDVTLAASFFSIPLAVRVSCVDASVEAVPLMAEHQVIDATTVRVYLYRLTTLGGNTWTAIDGAFCIAVHALPFADTSTPIAIPNTHLRWEAFAFADWNQLVANTAQMQKALKLEHDSSGHHNTRSIATGVAHCTYAGGAYALSYGSRVASVTKIGTGRARLTLEGTSYTLPLQVFEAPDYARSDGGSDTDFIIVNFPKSQYVIGSPSTIEAWIYRYNFGSNTWALADADFSCSIHTAPV